jgi:hypothetical protein
VVHRLLRILTITMADNQSELSFQPNLDMSLVRYVPGYDEPDADIVFVCSDKMAFRIHDYFLKAERYARPCEIEASPYQ